MCGEVFTLHREKSTQIPIGFCTHFISLVLCMGDWKRSQCTEANTNTDSQWFLYPFYLSWSLHGSLTKSLSGRISSKSLGPCSDHDLGLNCFAPIILDFFKPFLEVFNSAHIVSNMWLQAQSMAYSHCPLM